MNLYFDTIDIELAYVIPDFIKKYKSDRVFTVRNYLKENSFYDSIQKNYVDKISFFSREDVEKGNFDTEYYLNCIPVDNCILSYMSQYENDVLKMLERSGYAAESYEERIALYIKQIRFWNGFLDKERVGAALFCYPPHAVHDYIIFRLCQYRNLPVVMANSAPCSNSTYYFFSNNYENFINNEIADEYAGLDDKIVLLPKMEQEIRIMRGEEKSRPLYDNSSVWRNNRNTLIDIFKKRFKTDPINAILKSGKHCIEKIKTRKLLRYYETLTVNPNYEETYIYFPLQYQPEMTTSPLGGYYVHQYLAILMLSYYMPRNTYIYVKEHPILRKRVHTRKKLLYDTLKEAPNIKFISLDVSSDELLNNCIAAASMTGTIGYEALFKNKPFLMFGYRAMMYAPNTILIRSNKDCREAIDFIMNNKRDYNPRTFLYMIQTEAVEARFFLDGNADESYRKTNSILLRDSYMKCLDAQCGAKYE